MEEWERLQACNNRCCLSVVCLLIFGRNNFIIPAMVAIDCIDNYLNEKQMRKTAKEVHDLTPIQTFVIILMVTIGTMITRFLPFILFSELSQLTHILDILPVLPYSAIGLLVVYCLKMLVSKPCIWNSNSCCLYCCTQY